MTAARFFKYVGFGILGIGFVFLFVFVGMLLWNALIPSIFNGPELTFWQAAGLILLAKIFLSGFGPGRHKSSSSHRSWRSDRYRDCYGRKNKPSEDEAEVVTD